MDDNALSFRSSDDAGMYTVLIFGTQRTKLFGRAHSQGLDTSFSLLHLHYIQDPRAICFFHKQFAPLRVDPLIQRHAHRIHLRDGRVEMRFEVPVCSERFTDMARPAIFSV